MLTRHRDGDRAVILDDVETSTLLVCLTCGDLRGGAPREHRCACQDRQDPAWRQQWQGRDMACDLDLCSLCVRGTVGTASKWSWLACDSCRRVSRAVGRRLGGRDALALGRHSLMNGIGIRVSAPDDETEAQIRAFLLGVQGWQVLGAWQKEEFDRLAAPLRATADTVRLAEWQLRWTPSLAASVNAFERFTGIDVPPDLTYPRL